VWVGLVDERVDLWSTATVNLLRVAWLFAEEAARVVADRWRGGWNRRL